MFKVDFKPPEIKKIEVLIRVPDKAKSCDSCFDKWLVKVKTAGNTITHVDYEKKEVFALMQEFNGGISG